MKIHRIALEDYRGIEAREVELADEGVTLVVGPNEIGKSSLAEAIDLLFDELDSTTRQRVRAVQPVHRDEGAAVEADISVGPYRFTYAKRFHRRPSTRLTIHEPSVENLTGREAHQRVRSILDECVDTDLWRALRIQQGRGLDAPDLAGAPTLAAALDRAAGVETTGERERTLLDAAEDERRRWYTATGREAKVLRLADQAAETARATHEDLATQLERLEDDTLREAELERAIGRLERESAAAERGLRVAEAAAERVRELREGLARAESDREAARADEALALQESRLRRQLLSSHAGAVAEAAELADLMRDETPKLDSARREAEHAERAARAARAAAADAERAVAVCRDDLEHRRTEQSQRALRDQLSRVTRAREAGAAARRLVAESRVDEARVHEIQQAQVLVERARARLEAEGARVLLTPEIDLEVSVDGRRQRIAAGTPTECRVAESWMLHADGVADITVLAGASATEQRKRLEEADTRLRTLCAEIGVDDHAGAVQALEARRRAEGQIRESGLALEEALAGATELALEEKIARHEERIATYPTQRDDHGPIPPDAEAAAEALAAAEAHARHAGDARDQLDARRDDTRARHEGNERRLHETRVRLELAQGNLDDLGARLVAAREVREDEALEARREASHARAQAAESTLRDAQTRLAACDPDTVEAHACSARDERERAARALRDAKEERLEVRARMSVQADSGLFERTEEAQAAAETAERDRRATRRRAAAARLLAETLQARREASRAGYAEPLRREIVALGRRVYGDDFDVRLNDALQVERRTLDGIDLPVTSLSAGAREQLALLTRLACAQLVGGTGGVPILLDDALGHTDPERLRSLCDVLTAATACQVVLLSCDPGRFRSVDCARVVELG